jgi:hypothetical protein
MKYSLRIIALSLTLFLISGCSQSNQYGGGGYEDPCETLRSNYWSEYQAYKDARAANNGVEDEAVMSHYYASGEYAIQFSESDCEGQGYSLETEESGSSSQPENEIVDVPESEIVYQITDRLNNNSSLGWSIDQANDITGSNVIGVTLSDDGQCGVWIFDSVMDIMRAYDNGLFQYSSNWYGIDEQTQYGVMLITEDQYNQCADDFVRTVGWDGLE